MGLVLTVLVMVSLGVLALKDPGVVPLSSEPVGELSTFCEKCESYRPQGAIHCNDCNVCIEDYDHHCPWSSKVRPAAASLARRAALSSPPCGVSITL